ncbi:hypothetical protein Cni_G22220 [Canna indica]|uniref:Photolyase/cryptochrome alpha/beta domain-containing protein n=1 Tax=Canna indica TaxID=4628 RepID=A0AAQ3KRH7_9LILI|nr:hypothetical protein Cni_G22220 [Canna indica]
MSFITRLSSSPSFSKFPSFPTKSTSNPHFMSATASSTSGAADRPRLGARCHAVPGLAADEVAAASEEAFSRYSSPTLKRSGGGVAIVWFRNDLRLLDNEALLRAWAASESLLPVFCVDPRNFATTRYFGFPKTGALRAQFLIECLEDLKKNLMKRGSNLLIQYGKPEDILPSIAKAFCAHTVYAQKETCSEELHVERLVRCSLQQVVLPRVSSSSHTTANPKLDLLKIYKETRNGMLGADYSTKFSPWLASGSLSPRYIYEEVKRYEKKRLANDSTYW